MTPSRTAALVLAVASMITGVLGISCAARRPRMNTPTPHAASASPPATTERVPVARPPVPGSFVGVLLPQQMANVSSRAEGRLLDVRAKVGERVRRGDILVVFDARERRQELAMAEAQLRSAMGSAMVASAELSAARGKAARRTNAVARMDGRDIPLVSAEEASQAALDAQGAAGRVTATGGQVAEHRAKIAALRIALEETELRAPFDGTVSGTYFEAGMTVRSGETVVRVVGGGARLRVRAAVPEDHAAKAQRGDHLRIVIGATDAPLTGTLNRISPEVDPTTRALFVEGDIDARVDEDEVARLAGRAVRVEIGAPSTDGGLGPSGARM